MINVHNSFSKNCVTALLGVTLAFSPALALAKTTEGATKTNTDIAQVEGSEATATTSGLTDAERAELKALRDKSDAYWQAWDRLYETEGLTDAEWDRMNELEQKARLAKLETYLSGDEFAEFKRLYDKLDEELSLTDAEWDRFCALEDKARLAELEAYLTPEEFAELEGLYEKLDQEGELSDAEWERRNELEAKGPQDDYVF